MNIFRHILPACIIIIVATHSYAKKEEVDEVQEVQKLLGKAYELNYVDAAPVEISFIEKKIIQAKEFKEKRKKRDFKQLITEIKADLKIVKKRYEINQLQKQLSHLKQSNIESQRILDDLQGQLQ